MPGRLFNFCTTRGGSNRYEAFIRSNAFQSLSQQTNCITCISLEAILEKVLIFGVRKTF